MKNRKELSIETVIGFMDKNYTLVWIDYRENLNNSMAAIGECLEKKSCVPLLETLDLCHEDTRHESVNNIIEELKKKCVGLGFKRWEAEKFFEENEEAIREQIFERDDSDPIKALLRNTDPIPVRIELISNYDCINSHWFESDGGYYYDESYFGDMINALNLNPIKVKHIMSAYGEKIVSDYPNLCFRNGKEQVSYEDFYQEMINSCCGANLLTYIGTINLTELYDADFNVSEITIPKDNYCGLYSSMQGGGSIIEMKLLSDVKIKVGRGKYPYFRLQIDNEQSGHGYSIKDTYGLLDSYFGKQINLITNSQIIKSA